MGKMTKTKKVEILQYVLKIHNIQNVFVLNKKKQERET